MQARDLPLRRVSLRHDWRDAAPALLLFTGTVLYLAMLPRTLNPADEAIHLYDAKRVLNGAIPYRDFFNVITPGYMYAMAAVFWLFGTTIETARMATAVLHGAAAACVYLTCRRLEIRRGLAWPPAFAYLLVCQSAWPIASQHWLSTFLCLMLLCVCAGRKTARPAWAFVPGLVVGLLISVQQQRGVFMAAGVFIWLAADHAIARRLRPDLQLGSPVPSLLWLVCGTFAVVVPVCGALIAAAGFDAVWRALVTFPLFTYRPTMQSKWGQMNAWLAWQGRFTFPRLLRVLPVILLITSLRLIGLVARRQREHEARRLALLTLFCVASLLSIAYYPDVIHIAFIAPVFFIAAAECSEWLVRRFLAPARAARIAVSLAGAALLALGSLRLHQNLDRLRDQYPYSRSTAFGRVNFADPREAELYDKISDLMRNASSRYLYCYPILSHLYLMVDATNPTPYGFFFSAYNGPEQTADVLRNLAAKQPPYIVFLPGFVAADDPVAGWIRDHYEPIGDDGVARAIYAARSPH